MLFRFTMSPPDFQNKGRIEEKYMSVTGRYMSGTTTDMPKLINPPIEQEKSGEARVME
jgi:hypothetical protein